MKRLASEKNEERRLREKDAEFFRQEAYRRHQESE
jgi:hypothetical protein